MTSDHRWPWKKANPTLVKCLREGETSNFACVNAASFCCYFTRSSACSGRRSCRRHPGLPQCISLPWRRNVDARPQGLGSIPHPASVTQWMAFAPPASHVLRPDRHEKLPSLLLARVHASARMSSQILLFHFLCCHIDAQGLFSLATFLVSTNCNPF